MSQIVPGLHRKKPLVTYSRKPQRTPLSLDGAQFLKVPSVTRAAPISGSSDPGSSHEIGSAIFDCADVLFPSAQAGHRNLASSIVQAGQRRPPAYELPMANVPSSDRYIFASPMSRSVSDQDSIIDDQVSTTNAGSNKVNGLHHNRASRTLSFMRKALRIPGLHRSNTNLQPISTTIDSNGIIRGSDGFTESELTVVPGTRRTKARPARLSMPARMLDVQRGSHPNVDFMEVEICESRRRRAKSAAPGMGDEGCMQKPTTPSEADCQMFFDDGRVYAQLTSIVAPRRKEDLGTTSDNFEYEEYQRDLLSGEDEYPARDEDLEHASQGSNFLDTQMSYTKVIPGQLPRQHLDGSRWIGVDEDILDDDTSSMISDSFSHLGEPKRTW